MKDYTVTRKGGDKFSTVVEGNRNRQDLEVAALAVGSRPEVVDSTDFEVAHCSRTAAAAAADMRTALEEHQSLSTQSLRLFTFRQTYALIYLP